jgi:hypothetical protein
MFVTGHISLALEITDCGFPSLVVWLDKTAVTSPGCIYPVVAGLVSTIVQSLSPLNLLLRCMGLGHRMMQEESN